MSTKTIYGFDDLGNKVPIGEYDDAIPVTIVVEATNESGKLLVVSGGAVSAVSGGGTYNIGDSCTVTATTPVTADVNPSAKVPVSSTYYFLRWVEDDITVSLTSSYTFTVAGNTTLTAIYTTNVGGSDR